MLRVKRGVRDEEAPSLLDSLCMDCGMNTRATGEYYLLKDPLWRRVNPLIFGLLCLGCAEDRLGRPLCRADFSSAPLNARWAAVCPQLARRLKREPPGASQRSSRSPYEVKPRLRRMAKKRGTQSRMGLMSFQLLAHVGRNGRVKPEDVARVLRVQTSDSSASHDGKSAPPVFRHLPPASSRKRR